MKFYCLIADRGSIHNPEAFAYLERAVTARGLDFVVLEAASFDYGQDMRTAIETPSVIYRLGITSDVLTLEALLLRPGVASLYRDPQTAFTRNFAWGAAIRLQTAGLPIIPTIFNITKGQDTRLAGYVEKLGGFPVILKASGGSHGGSVLRLDSLESLRSVAGFVTTNTNGKFILRKYIDNATHLRMVVIGDSVADAIRYLPQPGDFRTNAVAVPEVEAYPNTLETSHLFELACQAVMVLGLDFGGVDLLLDAEGNAFIAEVNFPCNFGRNQMNTGVDIASMIVDHLVAKATSPGQPG